MGRSSDDSLFCDKNKASKRSSDRMFVMPPQRASAPNRLTASTNCLLQSLLVNFNQFARAYPLSLSLSWADKFPIRFEVQSLWTSASGSLGMAERAR